MTDCKKFRHKHGLSICEMASLLNVSQNTVMRYERNPDLTSARNCDPSAIKIMKIVDALSLDPRASPAGDKVNRLSSEAFCKAATSLGETLEDQGRVLGQAKSTMSRWKTGIYKPSAQVSKLLHILNETVTP